MLFFLKALVAMFTVIDPIGLVPVVIVLTRGMTPAERRVVALRAAIIAGAVLTFFGALGQTIFSSLGVTQDAFSIAGGALLFLVAIDMLFGRSSGVRETPREAREARLREDVSVFPLAIPLIAGPGSATTLILLLDQSGGDPLKWVAVAVASAVTIFACLITMLISLPIQKAIG
ncbi:MAG TPA: MarC family protein, partial [Chloroflexota bacterium]